MINILIYLLSPLFYLLLAPLSLHCLFCLSVPLSGSGQRHYGHVHRRTSVRHAAQQGVHAAQSRSATAVSVSVSVSVSLCTYHISLSVSLYVCPPSGRDVDLVSRSWPCWQYVNNSLACCVTAVTVLFPAWTSPMYPLPLRSLLSVSMSLSPRSEPWIPSAASSGSARRASLSPRPSTASPDQGASL